MKLRDYHYRDYEEKFVKVSNSGNVLDKLGAKDISEPFYGYLYVDIDKGVSLRFLGNDANDKYLKEKISLLRYDLIEDFEIEIIKEKLHFCELIKEQMKAYHGKENIKSVRIRREIDELRSRAYPDDVEIIVPFKEGYVEKIWGRSFDYIKSEDMYIFTLLTDSVYDKNLKKGTLIGAKYAKNSKAEALIFVGIIEEV